MPEKSAQPNAKLPPDVYHHLVQKIAERVYALMQGDARVRAERNPAERRRRKRT